MDARKLAVVCDGLRLSGGAFVPEDPKGVVVLLHGIPSVAPQDPDDEGYPGFARRFAAAGWTSVWADMRACRGSPGYFSIEGWVRDVRAIVDSARALDGESSRRLAVVGSSAGGAVAVEAVRRGAPADAMVLLGAPAVWVSFAATPREGLLRITSEAGMAVAPQVIEDPGPWAAEFEAVTTERAISSVHLPMLILHGEVDTVVPVDHAHRLAERAPHAELRIIKGAPHTLRRHLGVFEVVRDWLERTLT
jgi:alpha-beta hydrolase superfamily lysophospholipase